MQGNDPGRITNLTQLITSNSTSTVHQPSPDLVVNTLSSRFRLTDCLTSTYLGDSILVVLNPQRPLADTNLASQAEYEDRAAKVRRGAGGDNVQPHAYELACRVYLLMKRTGETQSVVFSGLSGSGSTTQRHLFTSQLLRLSTFNKKDARIAEQVTALETLLSSFGSAKTALNPSASRHATFLELHFTKSGSVAGAKVSTFGLDKSRVYKLTRDERTYHAFYQLLAGATNEERAALSLLDDFTSYALFQTSGCYRLPSGPGSDDSIAFEELRVAMKVLGFKPRHISSIFRLLSAILLLGNIVFEDRGDRDYSSECAWVANRDVLDSAAELLGIDSSDLERGLTNRVRWIRKEMCATFLKADGAVVQRDSLMAALYSILFAFVVETANHRLFPGDEAIADIQAQGGTSVLQLDTPGFHSLVQDRPGSGVLMRALNGFEEFCNNYSNEVVQFWMMDHQFDGDAGTAARAQEDGVRLPDVIPPDGSARIELLRGGRVGGKADRKPGGILGGIAKTCSGVRKGASMEEADTQLLTGMKDHFGDHTAFVSSPGGPGSRTAFGVSHFAGTVAYDAGGFIERSLDALDAEFVALFRTSNDGFISKLFSGPSLAAEVHPLDDNIIVSAQVSSQPLRRPTPIRFLPTSSPSDVDFTAPLLDPLEIHPLTSQLNATLSQILNLLGRTHIWSVISLRPNDSGHPGTIDTKRLRAQVSAFQLPELIARKKVDFVTSYELETFIHRHQIDGGQGAEVVRSFMTSLGVEQKEYALGTTRVWLSYSAWRIVEDRLRTVEGPEPNTYRAGENQAGNGAESIRLGGYDQRSAGAGNLHPAYLSGSPATSEFGGDRSPGFTPGYSPGYQRTDSADDLLLGGGAGGGNGRDQYANPFQESHSANFLSVPSPYIQPSDAQSDVWGMDKEAPAGFQAPPHKEGVVDAKGVPDQTHGATVREVPTSRGRMTWVIIVWALTWWIPSITLKYLGRMKRPDVRMAWREKVALCMLITFFCGFVIFYIIIFGKLICPNSENVWNTAEVSYHASASDYYVSVRGGVYDLTNFYKQQHSDITGEPVTSTDMLSLAGMDLTGYFPIPLTSACPSLVTDQTLALNFLNFTATVPTAVHVSGSQQPVSSSELHTANWYSAIFLPRMKPYYKGPLVWAPHDIASKAQGAGRIWAIYNDGVYDLTDYFNTISLIPNNPGYVFLNSTLTNIWQGQSGTDITNAVNALNLDPATLNTNLACMKTLFYQGTTDFRLTARCQVQPNLLLAFSILLATTILAKFLAALQLGSKRMPELRDKFVICQVPCYTEGEESLKKTIDSLAVLTYDDKRKLLLIICDGMIIGSGNDRPTPRIVLDILGVDQTVDPDPLMFKSVSEGSKQLNYGKVWSGLYESEGHVVPYIVVAKVGRPSERSRPGNRGKRDSQILAMRFLNRVHFDSEMYPLELEMYHQIKNVIGVDPQLYEYMLVIDADTSVAPDSLNRLVSCAADDQKIIGICGETKLDNEQASWWTMIQVYEYYISHHLSKAFESLFGSVTCLPGCFTMYRIRSADKGKPLLVSSLVIDEYSECNLDTLHKKNLLSLGEDRYLTTLILKHFPSYKTKFTPDAQAMTVAPDRWSILLSQRRRWINSTVHNLAELMFLPDMCGFCCFGMRFIVMIDLVGTLILPATCVYIVYLIVTVATGSSSIPIISLVLLGAVYGFQVILFLIKRQWQFIGWLVIYLLAYPIYSLILPLYSFWRFDDFTWGSTRVVVGEGTSKKILQNEDEYFEESMIPMKKFSEYQAALLEEDDTRSVKSGRTQSTAGFSLATKFPRGSYQGGLDYYRDTKQSRSSINQLATMPSFGGGYRAPSTHVPSEFGYPTGFNAPPVQRLSGMSFAPPAPPLQQQGSYAPSLGYGGGLSAPPAFPHRESHMSGLSAMSYGGGQVGQNGRSTSMYSMNPFMGPSPSSMNISESAAPSDQEIIGMLKGYLAHQDLMKVTKRSAREGIAELFPNADLAGKKDQLNGWIDAVLQGQL